MAEITPKRSGELLRGVFSILEREADGLPAKEVLRRLAESVPPNDFESAFYPNNPTVRRYEKIVRFGSILTVKAGWLFKEKGTWSLTEEGLQALKDYPDPAEFVKEAKQLYKKWAKDQPVSEVDDAGETLTEKSTNLEEAVESSWTEVSNYLATMDPYDFQDLVAGLLRGMGYHISYVSPPGPDKGIDIIAHTDPLGVTGSRIKVQVKRRQDKSDVAEIRALVGLLSESDAGIFVSTGGFTKNAEQETRDQYSKRLMLIDRVRLFDLWVEHYDKIPEAQRRLMPLKPVYYLAPVG